MGEVIFLDKAKADTLLSLGFKYKETKIDGKDAYVFLQSNELMKELSSKFDEGSFYISKTANF